MMSLHCSAAGTIVAARHWFRRRARPNAAACEISWLAAPACVSSDQSLSTWTLGCAFSLLFAGLVLLSLALLGGRADCAVLCFRSTRSAGKDVAVFYLRILQRSLTLTAQRF